MRHKQQLLVGLIGLLLLPLSAMAALDEGSQAPDFTLEASLDGQTFEFSLQRALDNGPAVVYFFPAAYTKGCDLEAHTFSEYAQEFAQANTTIIGVSGNSIDTLNEFSADPDFCAGDFAVASDSQGQVAKLFQLEMQQAPEGARDERGQRIKHGILPRVTFVINPQGEIIQRFSSKEDGLSPSQHVTRALAEVKKLQR